VIYFVDRFSAHFEQTPLGVGVSEAELSQMAVEQRQRRVDAGLDLSRRIAAVM